MRAAPASPPAPWGLCVGRSLGANAARRAPGPAQVPGRGGRRERLPPCSAATPLTRGAVRRRRPGSSPGSPPPRPQLPARSPELPEPRVLAFQGEPAADLGTEASPGQPSVRAAGSGQPRPRSGERGPRTAARGDRPARGSGSRRVGGPRGSVKGRPPPPPARGGRHRPRRTRSGHQLLPLTPPGVTPAPSCRGVGVGAVGHGERCRRPAAETAARSPQPVAVPARLPERGRTGRPAGDSAD